MRNDLVEQARKIRAAMDAIGGKMTDVQAFECAALFPLWMTDRSYNPGDRVRFGDTLYKCLQGHSSQSTWTPTDAPSLWARIDDPAEEWPAWVQPTGGHDAYSSGAKVSHKGKKWTSTADGNVWEPGVYGWLEAL